MKNIFIEKIVCNIGCGKELPIDNAKIILTRLTNKKPVITKSAKRSTFGVTKGKPIGCKITIRNDIETFVKRFLTAKENKLKKSSFDDKGNFAFGVKEYIDVPDMEYDPKIGIIGMDVCITLSRPGYSIKRKKNPHKIGKKHMITKEEAMKFIKETYNVELE